VGPFQLSLAVDHAGERASCELSARNVSDAPALLESVFLGVRWIGVERAALRFLRHGWQSWSFTGARALDEAGEPPFPSGPWLRGLHHALGAVPDDRRGWHESDLVTVVGRAPSGPACLAGALESGKAFGIVYARPASDAVEVEVELRLEVPLSPGGSCEAEPIHVALGHDASGLLESYAELLGRRAGARTRARFQSGWCSWYHFFHRVTEDDLRRNLEALVALRGELPVELIQLDDGFQRAVGDWLETNEGFPRGIAPIATAIRDAGFTPGIWTAPFCVVPESRLFAAHPDWLLRQGEALHLGLLHPQWSRDASVHVLDTSREEVNTHLMRTFAALVGMGFSYLKLDFLYTAAMQADAHDPRLSRAARLRRGLDAIRSGAGPESFLLGCGCPLGAAVGVVDAMRVGPDVAPTWEVDEPARIPGIEPTQPSTRNALRNVLCRAWMHRRLWLNDPDCLIARARDTELDPGEVRSLAATIAATGGSAIFSDDVGGLEPEGRALIRETIGLARSVDAAGSAGTARALDLLAQDLPHGVVARSRGGALVALVNASDDPGVRSVDLREHGLSPGVRPPEPRLGTAKPDVVEDARIMVELPAHATSLLRLERDTELAVFCDFDGTFAIQDVGATLARRHAAQRRPALWKRLERGELTAWDYNLELLDGLRLPVEELEAFLRSVELSPGARELVEWCDAREIPFRVLSDGFDYNLERLQSLHDIRFEFEANRLRYEDGAWRIEAAHPNPDCDCGTGTCKRGRIEAFRAAHPGARIVHIGNGRVSDLCAVAVADLVFAKDSLAEELEARDVPFERFETLRDVLTTLEATVGASPDYS
jgi:alpha-galactosidase